jgi:DNA replication protein DnaC
MICGDVPESQLHLLLPAGAGVCFKCRRKLILPRVPPLFQETDRDRLPQQWLQVAAWDKKTSLLLIGPSGSGKTRCVWELMKIVMPLQSEVAIFDSVEFGRELGRRFKSDDDDVYEWLGSLGKTVPLVVFDDLGKLKLTERVETELFGVIDQRYANKLPIIATTQLGAAELSGAMRDDRGTAMVRRIREMCGESGVITFG